TQSQKSMPYVRLGKSGLKVSKIILGCMSYGTPAWESWVLPEEDGIAHIKAAYDAGINTFDTANVYSNGGSEIVLGKAIKQHSLPRHEIVVMTKVFFTVARGGGAGFGTTPAGLDAAGYVNQRGLSRKHIFESVKHSLERLQLEYVDVLQCHRFDNETPIEETMQALHDVVQAGHARYIGMSSCWAWQCALPPVHSSLLSIVCANAGPAQSTRCRTTRSRTTSRPSSRCRTTTASRTARRS
ncbi:Aldo/keto reductase, partial [Athelia psychrophila]